MKPHTRFLVCFGLSDIPTDLGGALNALNGTVAALQGAGGGQLCSELLLEAILCIVVGFAVHQ